MYSEAIYFLANFLTFFVLKMFKNQFRKMYILTIFCVKDISTYGRQLKTNRYKKTLKQTSNSTLGSK